MKKSTDSTAGSTCCTSRRRIQPGTPGVGLRVSASANSNQLVYLHLHAQNSCCFRRRTFTQNSSADSLRKMAANALQDSSPKLFWPHLKRTPRKTSIVCFSTFFGSKSRTPSYRISLLGATGLSWTNTLSFCFTTQ